MVGFCEGRYEMVAHKQRKKSSSNVAALAASMKPIDINKLATQQGVKPLRSIDDLAMPSLEGENAEEILAELRAIRSL